MGYYDVHVEFAADAVVRSEQFGEKGDQLVIEGFADQDTVLKLVDATGDVKAASIKKTIVEGRSNRRAKVTPKQRYAIATAVLAHYKTAAAALAASYGMTEEEFMFNAGK